MSGVRQGIAGWERTASAWEPVTVGIRSSRGDTTGVEEVDLPRRPVLTFWLIAVALEVVLGRGVPGERRRVVDRCRVVEGGPRLRVGPAHGPTGRRGLPGRAPRRGARACPGRSTGPRGAGRCAPPGRPCPAARGRQKVPSVVEGGRAAAGTQDLARRHRRLLGLQPGERAAAPGVRVTRLRLALLLEHAGAASRGDVPRRRGTAGGERVARLRAPGPAPHPRAAGRLPHGGSRLGVVALPREVRRLHRLRDSGEPSRISEPSPSRSSRSPSS